MSTRSALAPTLSVTVVRGPRELEGVLQEVSHHRREDLPVSLDGQAILDGHDAEGDAPGVRFHRGGRRELVDEFGDEELLQILDTLGEPDLGERAADERVQSHEAAMEHGPGAP